MSSMKDGPLQVSTDGVELVIRIGVNTLAFAAENCPTLYDDETRDSPPYAKVSNPDGFARDFVRELQREREDGSGPLSDLFDACIENAIEDGSEWIELRTQSTESA